MEHQPDVNNRSALGGIFSESFDSERFWSVMKRSKYWSVGFILFIVSLSYLYIRYTKPVYTSESIVKLDFESRANALGLVVAPNIEKQNEIAGEIELIKSKLFLSKVLEVADIDVSYHIYGRYLTDERYRNSPFIVSYKIYNQHFYDKNLDVEIKNSTSFILEYTYEGQIQSNEYNFGEDIKTPHFNLLVEKTKFFHDNVVGERFYFKINSREAMVDYLQETLEVIPENFDAKTLKISFSDHKPHKAQNFVYLIDSLYLEYSKEIKNRTIEQKIDFLDHQIEQTEKKLIVYEEYFEQFTIENRTTDLGTDLAHTIQQLAVLDSHQINLKKQLLNLELLHQQVKEKGFIVIDPLMAESLPESLSESLDVYSRLQHERELKMASYHETSYVVQQIDLKIEKADDALFRLINVYEKALEKKLKQTNRRRKVLEVNLSQLPSRRTEYDNSRRFYNLHEEFLLSLQMSKMELEITKAGSVMKSVILSPASLPLQPTKPQNLLIILVGFMTGILLSIIYIAIRYLTHNKISGLQELEGLVNVPVLGAIPHCKSNSSGHSILVVDQNLYSSTSEALRTIRTNMDFINGSKGSKIISVASTISGEGKTFVVANLGAVMAMSGKKVCVIDIDMRKPKIHLVFGSNSQFGGVSTILVGKDKFEDLIQKTSIENLFFISAGPIPPNPSELILQKEFDEFLHKLSKEFDIVILDTPPVGIVTDGRLVMKKSDIQLYVVRADYSVRSFAKIVNDLKSTGQFSNMTIVLNATRNTTNGYGYYES